MFFGFAGGVCVDSLTYVVAFVVWLAKLFEAGCWNFCWLFPVCYVLFCCCLLLLYAVLFAALSAVAAGFASPSLCWSCCCCCYTQPDVLCFLKPAGTIYCCYCLRIGSCCWVVGLLELMWSNDSPSLALCCYLMQFGPLSFLKWAAGSSGFSVQSVWFVASSLDVGCCCCVL
jgi:hypothetical protein